MPHLELPHVLELETRSTCNRVCPTCIRNSHPNREAVDPWFQANEMPIGIFTEALRQARDDLVFRGPVNLSHYNEPLQDKRIIGLVQATKQMEFASQVSIHTNADFLTEELAAGLDRYLDRMTVALYMDEPVKSKRAAWIKTLFKRTKVEFTGGVHIATHFSPAFPVKELAQKNLEMPCFEPGRRLVLNHRGQMLFCCDDLIGNFDLGTFPEKSLKELWFSEKHTQLVQALEKAGGRHIHPYCETCPR